MIIENGILDNNTLLRNGWNINLDSIPGKKTWTTIRKGER